MLIKTRSHHDPVSQKAGRRSQQGTTLVEVILGFGILATMLLWTIMTLMSTMTTNNVLATDTTANAVILQKREEIQEVIKAAASGDGPAMALIRHYATLATIGDATGDNAISVGPDGKLAAKVRWDEKENGDRGLVYTFAVPAPADTVDANAPYKRGYGEMIIYLNESAVPVDKKTNSLWGDLGDYAVDIVEGVTGYDIDGNGKIENNLSSAAKNALAGENIKEFTQVVEPYRVPIDITVHYFSNRAHSRPDFETTRRMIVTGLGTMESASLSFK